MTQSPSVSQNTLLLQSNNILQNSYTLYFFVFPHSLKKKQQQQQQQQFLSILRDLDSLQLFRK